MDSILVSIKKMLGIVSDYKHFDQDIVMSINSVFYTLSQILNGPSSGFTIKGNTEKWSDFFTEQHIESVKTYTFLKVKLIFDPPLTSSVLDSMERQISELEWRLSVAHSIN